MFEPVCLDAMAPFCVSDSYQAVVELDLGYASMLPREQSPDPVIVERMGVTIFDSICAEAPARCTLSSQEY